MLSKQMSLEGRLHDEHSGCLGYGSLLLSYIKSLNDRIQELSSQLALHPHGLSGNGGNSFLAAEGTSLNVLMPGRGKDMYSDSSLPPLITRITFEVLSQPDVVKHNLQAENGAEPPPELAFGDRSILTPSIIRFLLGRYDQCIRPCYDIIPSDILRHDGMNLNKLPDPTKFYILIACAVAAARESYKAPQWKTCALVCRDWVNEFVTPLISPADGETLATVLLLLIFELADPSRGAMWELLDLATRTCLQLGWHRRPQILSEQSSPISSTNSCKQNGSLNCMEARLMSALRDIQKYGKN
ncbi:uncharacterized protein N7484_005366 [Penicillium longicatenatum]|uniref:uncharacterized protein n=1 Tax=Penicillium longicatenatum TaxID=1561947 RepID=UPI0025488201|nr:uncharacterized protein N7484_005366 [Penicillium longicatenatum]KAJ5642859.1 hypothetical protein N7484_005366 [Penicillium longicatenatum]